MSGTRGLPELSGTDVIGWGAGRGDAGGGQAGRWAAKLSLSVFFLDESHTYGKKGSSSGGEPMTNVASGELLTILTTAVALGSDAMSLGVGLGMRSLSKRDITRISVTIGLFHILMPLAGMAVGHYLHNLMGDVARMIGAALLIGLGAHMIWDAWRGDREPVWALDRTVGWGLFLFAMSVSIDALSAGFSFGLTDAHFGLAILIFGVVGGLMAAVGLSIGSLMGRMLGESMEIIGGAILIMFGLQFFF